MANCTEIARNKQAATAIRPPTADHNSLKLDKSIFGRTSHQRSICYLLLPLLPLLPLLAFAKQNRNESPKFQMQTQMSLKRSVMLFELPLHVCVCVWVCEFHVCVCYVAIVPSIRVVQHSALIVLNAKHLMGPHPPEGAGHTGVAEVEWGAF